MGNRSVTNMIEGEEVADADSLIVWFRAEGKESSAKVSSSWKS